MRCFSWVVRGGTFMEMTFEVTAEKGAKCGETWRKGKGRYGGAFLSGL